MKVKFEKYVPKIHSTNQPDKLNESEYKFILTENYDILIPIYPFKQLTVQNDSQKYIELNELGQLTIFKGYAWDGASGGAIQTDTNLRGALVHDALYQLLRSKLLTPEYRLIADQIFYDILREDGMNWFRAQYFYRLVRLFGGKFVA
jgi:hypothetical protein